MAKNRNLIYIPKIKHRTVKNPATLWPVNWEEKVGEDRVSYDEEPIFDKDGNFIEMRKNIYVVMEELVGFHIIRRKNKGCSDNSKYRNRKLFETYSDKKKGEEDNDEGR